MVEISKKDFKDIQNLLLVLDSIFNDIITDKKTNWAKRQAIKQTQKVLHSLIYKFDNKDPKTSNDEDLKE